MNHSPRKNLKPSAHAFQGLFSLDPPPLRKLPDAYFDPWESLIADLPDLLLAGRLRLEVKKLQVLDTMLLTSLRERERAYLVLSFLAHAYVWGYPKIEGVETFLPEALAVPWFKVSSLLGRKPVISYAATVLYNYRRLDPNGPFDLSNLAVINTFTGSMDESWFYLISLAIEIAGSKAIPAILKIHNLISKSSFDHNPQNADKNELKQLAEYLNTISTAILEMTPILVRMHERNDPNFFFNRTRWFQSGWKGVENNIMPYGLFYEGVFE
ncbi:hypothetical protein HK096_002536, partial [Nowakowskiella sp. JEL0078]